MISIHKIANELKQARDVFERIIMETQIYFLFSFTTYDLNKLCEKCSTYDEYMNSFTHPKKKKKKTLIWYTNDNILI